MVNDLIIKVGNKEIETKQVSVRRLGSKEQINLDLIEALDKYKLQALPPDLARDVK